MEIFTFWIIVTTSIIHFPSYNGTTVPKEQIIELHFPHDTKASCEKIAKPMFINMKKKEPPDSSSKLLSVQCLERIGFKQYERSISNRTQGNWNRSIPDS